jgi:hypothetical protein
MKYFIAAMLIGLAGCAGEPEKQGLSVDEVIGWKQSYAGYLGKSVAEVLKSFGIPVSEKVVRDYSYLEFKVKDGSKTVGFSYLTAIPVIKNIYISSDKSETLDINKVLVKAEMFSLYSGRYVDSTEKYLNAQDRDGNALQFTINQSSLTFRRLIVGKEDFGARGLYRLGD